MKCSHLPKFSISSVWREMIENFFTWTLTPQHTSVHILNTVLHTSLKVLTRRICLKIRSLLNWCNFLYSSDLNVKRGDDIEGRNYMPVTIGVKGFLKEYMLPLLHKSMHSKF